MIISVIMTNRVRYTPVIGRRSARSWLRCWKASMTCRAWVADSPDK